MTSVAELLEELETHTERFREEFGHLVSFDKFARAGAVVQELEEELGSLGLPVAPVETLTQSVLAVAQHIHDHLTAGASEKQAVDLDAQIAALQAKKAALGVQVQPDPPDEVPKAPADPSSLFKAPPPVEPEAGSGG